MVIHVDAVANAPGGAGCMHVAITITTPRGERTVLVDRADLISAEPPEDESAFRERMTTRLRCAVKEAGATTAAQARAAILNKDFAI